MKYFLFLALIVFVACSEDDVQVTSESLLSTSQSQEGSNDSMEPRASDPFQINSVDVENENLLVEVNYSGGCHEHEFELIWPSIITAIFPPDFGVILAHNANDDACEASLMHTLVFDMSDNPLGLTKDAFSVMRISVINDSDNTNVVSNR